MYNYVLFWISYLLFALRLTWFLKRLFRDQDTPSRACKTRSGGAKPIIPPYVENNYRIEVKITFTDFNSLPSATLSIFWRIFDFSLLQTSLFIGRYLQTSALKCDTEFNVSETWRVCRRSFSIISTARLPALFLILQ